MLAYIADAPILRSRQRVAVEPRPILRSEETMKSRTIRKTLHVVLAAVLVVSLCATPSIAQDDADESPSADLIVLDLVFFRPVRLLTFIVGSAAFIATMPIPYIFGDTVVIDDARDRAFSEPASELFERPLGDL